MMNTSNKEKGFTLIELMIVVAIIGILASIAIPQFASYRVKAFNAAGQADLHSAQSTFELFFTDNSKYPNAVAPAVPAAGAVTLSDGTNSATLNVSNGVGFGSAAGTNNQTYSAATKHTSGDTSYNTSSASPTISASTGLTKGTTIAASDLPAAP